MDKQIAANLLIAEYNRLTTDMREDTRNMYTWLALIGAMITAAGGAAFLNWEKSPVPEILLNVAIPLIVLGWIGFCYCIAQRNNIRTQYMSDVLQEEAKALLGSGSGQWPSESGDTAPSVSGISEKQPGSPVSNVEAEMKRPRIWNWDRWD